MEICLKKLKTLSPQIKYIFHSSINSFYHYTSINNIVSDSSYLSTFSPLSFNLFAYIKKQIHFYYSLAPVKHIRRKKNLLINNKRIHILRDLFLKMYFLSNCKYIFARFTENTNLLFRLDNKTGFSAGKFL